MANDRIKTGDTPLIHIQSCGGELILRGWAESNMRVRGDYDLEESEKGYRLSSRGTLYLHLPEGATVRVSETKGNLTARHLNGECAFDVVRGDVVLSELGDVTLGIIHGNLAARNIGGHLSAAEINGDMAARNISSIALQSVHGDVAVRRAAGDILLESISGDVDLRNIEGDITITEGHRDVNLMAVAGQVNVLAASGDIRLRGALTPGDHLMQAEGDIIVRWPAGTPVKVTANGGRIDNRVKFDELNESNGNLIGRIGAGSVNITLKTAGRIILKEAEPAEDSWERYGEEMDFDIGVEMAGISARIETEINNHLSRVTRDLEGKFGPEFGRRMSEKFARKSEKAAERTRRRWGRGPASDSPITPAGPRKPATTEEQLKILKMVETGKISPEEASMLLEALEN